MAKKFPRKKSTVVNTHKRKVKVTPKNPDGITIVDEHVRRLAGTFLDEKEIYKIRNGYNLKTIIFPKADDLDYHDGNLYDDQIAMWSDYFNQKFNMNPPIDPDMVKALIGSESGFDIDPLENKVATGIAQITKETLKAMQDPKGEVKDFIFNDISNKDLKNPEIAIPMAIRWLAHKQKMSERKLGRSPTHEDIILEYKGLTKSTSRLKGNALKNYRRKYDRLKK